MLRRLKHWLAHRLGLSMRVRVSWTARDGTRWDALVCEDCGVVSEAEMWLGPKATKFFYGEK